MWGSRIFDPNAGRDVEVTLQAAEDGLYIFGSNRRRLHRWPYDEIVNATSKHAGWEQTLVLRNRREIRLTVDDPASYDEIVPAAPQLRRPSLASRISDVAMRQIFYVLIVLVMAAVFGIAASFE
ncbi:hypothetical protein [Dongia sp.]|uniref:hypothetical protein n=1 Tax=Dongia sp. TaxID=1977262 RepID=UPI003751A213